MIEHNTNELGDVRLHYVEAAGPGPALLFIHGATGSHTSFLPFMPALAQHAHTYALDLRGHGLSGHTPGAYRLADYGQDVASFLRKVVGKPAILAGHSLGGYVALWVAAEEPALVERLFLEDPPIYLTELARFQETMFYHFFAALQQNLPVHHARGGTVEDLAAYVGQMPANEEQTMLDVAGPEWVHMRGVDLHQLDPAMLEPALNGDLLGPYEPDTLLSQVRCPVRLLAAQYELGGAMNAQDVERAVTQLAQCEHTVFAGVGHGIHEERPDEYVAALVDFVTAGD
jgi:pimeloyl-ACP methyl ester carboxylesterase